jgi:prolyl-tRNA editing enzyme YbaK/EbsC (Cys-tRNA(Pro) deacylase)
LFIERSTDDFDPVEAVSSFLSDSGFDGRIFHTEETIFTVSDAASAVGAPEEEILKSILLRVNRGEYFALALMSGVNRVDTKKIKKILGASHVSFANPEECCEWSGFRPGGVPPVGYPEQPRSLLDEDLFNYSEVWAAAGTDHAFFPISPAELLRITGGEKADIKIKK